MTQPLVPFHRWPLLDALERLLDRYLPVRAAHLPHPEGAAAPLRPSPGPSLRDWTRRKAPQSV